MQVDKARALGMFWQELTNSLYSTRFDHLINKGIFWYPFFLFVSQEWMALTEALPEAAAEGWLG